MLRRCELCTAVHDAENKRFIVSHGPPMDERKFNSRCCHYARQRGRQGCINPCTAIDHSETLEGRIAALNRDIDALHPEIKEILLPTPTQP